MTKNSNEKKAARERSAQEDISYVEALRKNREEKAK